MSKKDIDFSIINHGPLYVDPRHIKPGYHYAFVGDLPGQIEMYERWGYEIVKDTAIRPGDKHASDSTSITSAVTVKSKCGQTLYFMAIEDEIFEKLQSHRDKLAHQQKESIGHLDNIPEQYQIGTITTSNKH